MSERNFSNFPGFLGLTSQGVIAIHADWPMYPAEHGWEVALLSLGYHPPKTIFYQIDDIDRCILLFAGDIQKAKDPFDENSFHVAIWHEDLIQLQSLGFVSGIIALVEYEWELHRFTQTPKGAHVFLNGQYLPIDHPTPPEPDENNYETPSWAVVTESGLTVTDKGYKALHQLLVNEKDNLNSDLMATVQPLMDIGKYDSAIRDACILIETQLRNIVKTNSYGMALTDQFFSKLFRSKKYIPAKLKVFRSEIKTAFKFIRNDYAHNLRSIEIDQCYAILWRLSEIYTALESFKESNLEIIG